MTIRQQNLSTLLDLIEKYEARSTSELYDKCKFYEWQDICNMQQYHELIKTAIELSRKYNLDIQRMDMFKFAASKALSREVDIQQQEEFKRIFEVNNINVPYFAACLYNVLNKVDFKINCLRFVGVPNSCKTLIAGCIAKFFVCCHNNNHGSENEFYMSNLLNQALIWCEELYVTIATAEDFKSVLGGQPIDISKKFNEKQLLSRTPALLTSNYLRFGRGHLSPTDENALALRCYTFNFICEYKPNCYLDAYQFYQFILSHLAV